MCEGKRKRGHQEEQVNRHEEKKLTERYNECGVVIDSFIFEWSREQTWLS